MVRRFVLAKRFIRYLWPEILSKLVYYYKLHSQSSNACFLRSLNLKSERDDADDAEDEVDAMNQRYCCILFLSVTTEKKDNVHSHGNGLCNVGKSRRLYEYQFPTQRNSNYKVQVALVDNANNFAQIYFTSANRTWKNPPTVTNTTKSNFDSILRQSNRYKYIGKIKEGKW